jgi:uncharacterized protein (DUF433 family)
LISGANYLLADVQRQCRGRYNHVAQIVKEVVKMEIAPNISVDHQIHHGAPVITGTRMPVSIIVGSLAGGMSKEEVSREYAITMEQIETALSFAAEFAPKSFTKNQNAPNQRGNHNETLDAQLDET